MTEKLLFVLVLALFFASLWCAEALVDNVFKSDTELPLYLFICFLIWLFAALGGILLSYLVAERLDAEWAYVSPSSLLILSASMFLLIPAARIGWLAPVWFCSALSFSAGFFSFY